MRGHNDPHFFLRFYLSIYFWVRVWVAYSIFVRDASDISLGFLDPCPIRHYIYFYVTYLHALMQVDHHSLFYLFAFFYLSFFSHHTWCLTWVQHPHFILTYSIFSFLYHHFREGILRSMIHDVFYTLHLMHEGYGDYIIGIFEPSFPSFLSPYYLRLHYVPCLKTTLRPLLYIVFDSSHAGNTRA